MSRRIVAAALVIGLIGPAAAVELNPKAIAIRQADDIKWRDPTGAAPVNQRPCSAIRPSPASTW